METRKFASPDRGLRISTNIMSGVLLSRKCAVGLWTIILHTAMHLRHFRYDWMIEELRRMSRTSYSMIRIVENRSLWRCFNRNRRKEVVQHCSQVFDHNLTASLV